MTRGPFRRLDRHLYRRLEEGGRYAFAEAIFVAMAPGLVGSLIAGPIALWSGVAASVALMVILCWRIYFVLRVRMRAADHQYDAVGKYRLPKDYWDTESATAARKGSAK